MNKVQLSEIANIVMGQSPEGSTCNDTGNGVPLLNGPTEFTDFYPIPKQYTTDPKRLCKAGDILFCVRGSTTGRMNWSDNSYAIGRGLAALSHKKGKNLNHFLKYLIQNNLNSILNSTSGSTFPNLTNDMLASYKFIVPDLPTQQKIAVVLSTLDAKIELNNRINAELEALAKTIYDYWFVQFDFPDGDGRPYKSSGGKMVWNEELKREIPEGWDIDNILMVGELLGGGTPKTIEPSFWDGHIPFFTPTDSTNSIFALTTLKYITEFGLQSCSSRLFPKGTIFITARGTVGNINIAAQDMAMNQSCYAIWAKPEINYYFLHQCCINLVQYLKAKANGSIFDAIVSNDIKLTYILIPPLPLIQEYGRITENIYEKILANSMENQTLSELRDWLLPMLMNGQVTVN